MGDSELRKELASESLRLKTAEKQLAEIDEQLDGSTVKEMNQVIQEQDDKIAALENELATEAHRLNEAWKQITALKNAAPEARTPVPRIDATLPAQATALSITHAVSMAATEAPAPRQRKQAVKSAPRQVVSTARQRWDNKSRSWQPA